MTANYTPGPWYPNRVAASGDFTVRSTNGNQPIARIRLSDRYDDGPTTEANARLIATAPELLAALVTLIHNGPMPQTGKEKRAYQTAAAAIAKAEGTNP